MAILSRFLLFTVLSFSIAGCTAILPEAHKIDVQQGNVIKQDKIDRLKTGMTKRQVQFLIGTPILKDIFHKNRWDYVSTFKPGGGEQKTMRLTLFFEGDKLVKIDNVNYEGEK